MTSFLPGSVARVCIDVASRLWAVSQADGVLPLREQQRAFTRRRLMDAGRTVFSTRGYPDTTVDDIVREAGTSRATFYLHFKGKGDLVAALIDDIVPFAVARYQVLDALLVENGPALREQLHVWLSEWLDYWIEGADINHALHQAGMLEAEVEAHLLHVSETLIDSLERYLGSMPEAEKAGAHDRALTLEIMTQRIFALASRSRLPLDNKDVMEILVGMWFEVLVDRRPG